MRLCSPKIASLIWALVLVAFATARPIPTVSPREHRSLDLDWRFHLGDPPGAAEKLAYEGTESSLKPWILPTANPLIKDRSRRFKAPNGNPGADLDFLRYDFDDHKWSQVHLPHDWAIAGPFLQTGNFGGMGRLKTWGVGWYRRKIALPAADRGKRVMLEVDGAMACATVWVNGKIVGGWPYGYASWQVDLTPYLVPGGKNLLAMRLENLPDSSRWYPGAGLFRNVWLTKTDPVHVPHWGSEIRTTDVSKSSAKVEVSTTLANETSSPVPITVETDIFELNDKGAKLGRSVGSIAPKSTLVSPHDQMQVDGELILENPKLWGPPPTQTPNRYTAVTTVRSGQRIVDQVEAPFGIRNIKFDPNVGVLVNGEHIPLNGLNNHHDLGALGAAWNTRAAERQLQMLQEMGANALRMSHNPPAPEMLDLADRMGFLVIDEIFDSWYAKKTPNDFHLIFKDWQEPDLRAMIRRDRNHPSVFIWSVGNEVGEQFTGEAGATVAKELVAIAHEEDPSRPVMTAMNWSKPDMPLPNAVDLISTNYQGIGIRSLPGNFPEFHKRYPDRVIFSSESAAALSSHGEYQFPVPGVASAPVRPGSGGDPKTRQLSAYELFAADFGSSADRAFAAEDQNPYVAGEFVWTGWDYLGEPTPYYDARSSYFGIIDLAGFKKDRFYLYQSRWRPDLPMAHLLPHWTWPGREGEVTPVHVFTSGDQAELFVNGKSQGMKAKGPFEYRLRWDYVTYEPGEISVVAYKNGKVWAKDSIRTAGQATKLEATADRSSLVSDGKDLAFITVRVTDDKGQLVPQASNRIKFRVEGPAEIVGTDNGNPMDFDSFLSPGRKAFNGLGLVIIRTLAGKPGKIQVHVDSDALSGASVVLESLPSQ